MKIIFITREPAYMPAVKVRSHGFAGCLNNAGISAEVFSYADDLKAKSGEFESQMGIFEKLGYNLKAVKYLFRQNAVLCIQRCNYHSLAPFLLGLFFGKKIIFDLDDWEAKEEIKLFLNLIPNSFAFFLMVLIAKKSMICIGASRFLESFLSKYNKNTVYIPTAVDTDLFIPHNKRKQGSGSDDIILSWIGTVYRQDNLENLVFLIDCFKRVAVSAQNIRLEIAARGIYEDRLKEYIDKSGCKNIVFRTWINGNDIPGYLETVDIGIMPLIQNSKFNQAKSPTRMFEYMAMEKPFLTSAVGEAGNIIIDGQNGMLAENKEQFIKKMNILISDRLLRDFIGKNARKTVLEKYSLKKVSEDLISRIKKI